MERREGGRRGTGGGGWCCWSNTNLVKHWPNWSNNRSPIMESGPAGGGEQRRRRVVLNRSAWVVHGKHGEEVRSARLDQCLTGV